MGKITKGAKNLFGIAKRKAQGEDISVPEKVAQERLAECLKCPNLSKVGTCKICLCIVRAKTKVDTESCPDNPSRWGKYIKEENVG